MLSFVVGHILLHSPDNADMLGYQLADHLLIRRPLIKFFSWNCKCIHYFHLLISRSLATLLLKTVLTK